MSTVPYIVHDAQGNILRTGLCQEHLLHTRLKAEGEHLLQERGNPHSQQVREGRVVDKTLEEMEAEKPPKIPPGNRPARITQGQLDTILTRLSALEERTAT